MAEIIKLQVSIDQASKQASLNEIQQFAAQLSKTPINLNTAATKQATKATTEYTKVAASAAATTQTVGTAATKQAAGLKTAEKATKNLTSANQLLGASLGVIALKMAVWQIMGQAISFPIRKIKEAVETLKEVDTQLVSIRKVTQLAGDDLEKFTQQAYDAAGKYGRTVTDALEANTAFARAGYTDEALQKMSELSLLTQNVGDVTAEEANSFILAADAAWKLKGNEAALTAIIDGMNEVTNKNATDMEKLTAGITVAGSVFASAGESAETFTALLGAATAATQRSGSEMARGLRTILMNIRQIKGETEDGELIDGESIANASKALKEYADVSTMANGQLRKASDVLDDLAGKWETLDTVAQSAIAEALAGKRQANVLTSLMEQWDMVDKMASEYADASGSAIEENDIYMQSWAAATNELNNAWTELISKIFPEDEWVEFLHNLTTVISALSNLIDTIREIKNEVNEFINGNGIISTLIRALELVWGTIERIISPLGAIKGLFKDIVSLSNAFNGKSIDVSISTAAVNGGLRAVDSSVPTYSGGTSSGMSSGSSSGTSTEDLASSAWSKLVSAMNKALKAYKANIDAQTDAIDEQIDALKKARDVEEDALTLEEKKLAVLEAQKDLLDAQTERTVRIYNAATDQWEWIADAGKVKQAEDAYKDARDDLKEYLDKMAYEATLAELEAQKDALQAQYEAFADEWERIQDSIETPAQDLTDALAEIAYYGTPAMQSAVGNINGLLGNLGVSLSGFLGTVNAAPTSLGGTAPSTGGTGSGTGAGRDNPNVNGPADILKRLEQKKKWPSLSGTISAGAIAGGLMAAGFDSGGVLKGKGNIKNTDEDEVILAPSMAKRILSPKSNAEFNSFVESLGLLFGVSRIAAQRGNVGNNSSTINTDNGNKYYINGMSVGAREAETMPLSKLLSVLPIYVES